MHPHSYDSKEKQSDSCVAYRRTVTRRFTVLRTVTLTVTLALAIITPPFNIPLFAQRLRWVSSGVDC